MLILVATLVISCDKFKAVNEAISETDLVAYKDELKLWDKRRAEILSGPNGWLNVRGLFWLKEGINSFGSGSENDIVFPEGKIAKKAGFIMLKDTVVAILVLPEVMTITSNKIVIKSGVIFHPDSAKAKILESGSLQWFVVKRSDKIGIRLRDFETEKLTTFKGIERYEADLKWRVKAKLTVQPGKTIEMMNVLGQLNRNPAKGTLSFSIDEKEYTLDAIDEDGKLFIIFGDPTNGETTYGSGRYLYAAMPEGGDEVDLDFNHAINPPCAFTEFATCLLPPKQNILPIKVEAGEKAYH
jgi:uncharacterized protein